MKSRGRRLASIMPIDSCRFCGRFSFRPFRQFAGHVALDRLAQRFAQLHLGHCGGDVFGGNRGRHEDVRLRRFLRGQVPQMDVPFVMGIFLKPMLFVIEVAGMIVKHVILAMRLFANMFAGHLVLAVILGFIVELAGTWIWYGVAPVSVLGSVALNLLELLVCFIQAYVFTFLAAIFIGMAVHQH